jgi:hypothetical protein
MRGSKPNQRLTAGAHSDERQPSGQPPMPRTVTLPADGRSHRGQSWFIDIWSESMTTATVFPPPPTRWGEAIGVSHGLLTFALNP